MDGYYLKLEDKEKPAGPYSVDELKTLAAKGIISDETLFFDSSQQLWFPLRKYDVLWAAILNPRKRLALRKKQSSSSTADNSLTAPMPSVQELISAQPQQGELANRFKQKQAQLQMEASRGPVLTGLMAASAFALLSLPCAEAIQAVQSTGNFNANTFLQPKALLGGFDAILSGLLFLKTMPPSALFRIRALFGTAYLVTFYSLSLIAGSLPGLLWAAAWLFFGLGLFIIVGTAQPKSFRAAFSIAALASLILVADTALKLWTRVFAA